MPFPYTKSMYFCTGKKGDRASSNSTRMDTAVGVHFNFVISSVSVRYGWRFQVGGIYILVIIPPP